MSAHGASLKLYFVVFGALLVLTWVTVAVASVDLGAFNTPVALAIASTKGMLVILYFMHLRWSTRLAWVYAVSGILFLVILLGFTMSDYVSRDWIPVYGEGLNGAPMEPPAHGG